MLAKLMLVLIVASTPPATSDAGKSTAQPQDRKTAGSSEPLDGFWPSRKLTSQLVRRWALEIGDEYDLDKAQQRKTEAAFAKRWTGFLDEHRAEIQPLLNEFLELRLEIDPPEKRRVQDWAKRAGSAFGKIREQVNGGMNDVREVLRPEQRIAFEVQSLALGVGMQAIGEQLEKWEAGDFKREDFWEATGPERRRRREARRQALKAGRVAGKTGEAAPVRPEKEQEPAEEDQIALELKAWDAYVAEFIKTYALDEAQRLAARSCLTELKQRARDHRDRRKAEIAKLEQKINEHTGSLSDLGRIKELLTELYGPVDEMFAELRARLKRIPTANQRAKVEQEQNPKPDGE